MEGPTTPPAVPDGWRAVWSKSKKAYYFISPKGESVWVLPKNRAANLPDGWQRETNKNGRTFYANTLTGSSVYEKPTKEVSNAIRKSVIERNKGEIVPKALQGYTVAPTAAAAGEVAVGIPAPETCGIRNPDITCYMNSTIQLLYTIDDFRAKILASRSHNPYIQAMRMIFYLMTNTPADATGRRIMSPPITQLTMELSDQPGRPFSLRALFSTLTIDYDNDRIGHQMDASEFMNRLLEKIDNTIRRDPEVRSLIRAREYSAENVASPNILERIGQITKSEYNCLHGGRTPDNIDTFEYIAALKKEDTLDWTKEVSVQMLLDTRENNENDPDNWFDGCKPPPGNGGTRGPFRKRTRYLPTSEYFICQITPYVYSDARQTPVGSSLGDFIRDTSGNRLRPVILNPTIRINDVNYGLSGYILHVHGNSLRSGHYVYVKCGDDNMPSIVINDHRIIRAADSEFGTLDIQKRHGYIALYKLIGGRAVISPAELQAIRANNARIIGRIPPGPAEAPPRLRLNNGSSLDTLRQLLKVKGVRVYTDAELDAMIGRAVPANWETNTGTVGWPVRKSRVEEGLPVSPGTLAAIKAADGTNFNMTNSRSAPGATMSPGTIKQLKLFGLGGRYKKTRKNKSRRRSTRRHLKRKF
jgi:hypothetical protein